MNAKDIMSSPVITVSSDATVGEAADLMLEHGTSCLPVLDESGQLASILTHTDFGIHRRYLSPSESLDTLMGSWVTPGALEEVSRRLRHKPLKEIMRSPVITVQEWTSVSEVANLMLRNRISRIPVMRGDKLVGIITRHDFIKLMAVRVDIRFL